MAPVQHIFLTGFMGSGKSTLGKKLATLMQYRFADLDDHIEKKEKTTIQLIFDNEGETSFRGKEAFYLEELAAASVPTVIALGGGTICFGDNLRIIKQHGILIYLDVPVIALARRISGSRKKRPLLQGLAGDVLQQAITNKLEQRQQFYAQAHITVGGSNITPELLHQAILEAKQNHIV